MTKAGAKETVTKTGSAWHFTGGRADEWKFSVEKLSVMPITEWVITWRALNAA